MRVLIACEFSGIVRDAFRARGHDAWSCDLLPSEGKTLGQYYPEHYPARHQLHAKQFHYECDVFSILPGGGVYHTMALEDQAVNWDLLIAHPPCTYLAVSGNRWLKGHTKRRKLQAEAFEFFMRLALADIPMIAMENPVSVVSSRWRKPDQVIQPWQFGHPENKKTCLWLKGLPLLEPTKNVYAKMKSLPVHLANRVHHEAPGLERSKNRSRTFQGIADAMAAQWGAIEQKAAA